MGSGRKNPCDTVTSFIGSFFRQMKKDFEKSYENRKSEPLYAFTRYIPRTEDLPILPGANRYTLIRQLYNVVALASWFQSKEHFAAGVALSPVLNAYLQHIVYPSLKDTNEVVEPKASLRRA